ncbi:MAG: hypothetical protein HYX65_08580 [Gemmatimonadetes bacterium]|nr:hypothetical protein [Gemmatimonadota bacterium]
MPLVALDSLPDDARTWVFAAEPALSGARADQVLAAVDDYLAGWQAHGHPLKVGRTFAEHRFLVVAVDQRTEGASGCSIDGLFRALQGIERAAGVSLVAGGRAFWRDQGGAIRGGTRDAFGAAAARGEVGRGTHVFDTTVTTLGDWRERFERTASESWHAQLLHAGAAAR